MKSFLILLLVIFSIHTKAEEKLRLSSVFTEFAPTTKEALSISFSKDAIPWWGVILGSTGVLYQYDEELYSDFQRKGRAWGIGNEDNTKQVVTLGGQELVRLPSDTGSAMYFLGDGWMHAGIATGFATVGQFTKDTRAFNTGVMIAHGMVVSTVFNQTLKRSFGRESPEVKTSRRGSWNLFPSFNDYNTKTASYDAMPSGHIMTATLTFTIITERYPEYQNYLYPLAGVWLTALGFQMVNNGVHWASDYPLGIAMGYVIGKASTQMVQRTEPGKKDPQETSWMILPSFTSDVTAVTATRSF